MHFPLVHGGRVVSDAVRQSMERALRSEHHPDHSAKLHRLPPGADEVQGDTDNLVQNPGGAAEPVVPRPGVDRGGDRATEARAHGEGDGDPATQSAGTERRGGEPVGVLG